MKCTKSLCCLFIMFLNMAILHAQDSHWNVNIHNYQYDMTVYAQVVDNKMPVTDYSNLEVAAFVGDECRGVATIQSAEKEGVTYRWLSIRVRSNVESGEEISFRVYDKSQDQEITFVEKVTFDAMGVVGLPSSPKNLNIGSFTLGDVNEDGNINIADVACILSFMAGNPPAIFNESAADANEDGAISIADAARILYIMAGH